MSELANVVNIPQAGDKPSLATQATLAILTSPHVLEKHPGFEDDAGRQRWIQDMQALMADAEHLFQAVETSPSVTAILNDPDFEAKAKDKRILTGRLIAVTQLGPTFSCIALQNGFGKEMSIEEAKAEWNTHFRDSDAHSNEGGYLRDVCGIERLFLPPTLSLDGLRVLRAAKSLVDRHVRVWKTLEPFEDSTGKSRKKRIAVHIEELPTDFEFRKGLTVVRNEADAGDPFESAPAATPSAAPASSTGMSSEDFIVQVGAHNAANPGSLITEEVLSKSLAALNISDLAAADDQQRSLLMTMAKTLAQ